jgi:ribonuclease HI
MGAGFCNLGQLGWNTQTLLPPSSLHDQHTRNSRKLGREDEGASSTRPEMVSLTECLEDHGDDISLLYLTDSEAILQAIHRWIGCGAKLNLSKSPDVDVLKKIIIKLQRRVLAGAATLLVKVKTHRGDSLNEEADIRTEMGHHKEIKETGWNDPTDRTICRWKAGQITRSTSRTNTVRNRFRQKSGEIEAFRALEIGVAKWCKEHIPHKGNNLNDITDEGISLLDDAELWWEKQNLLWACHTSRSKDRMNNDGSFVTHQLGVISSTFTSDWYLRKGDSRDKMGEWLKRATVRSQDHSKQIHTPFHRTIGEIKSQTARNQTSVTSAEPYGYPKGDSTRKTSSLFKP